MSTPTATPRTQALWMKHHAFSTEEEATEALCDFRDHGNALEAELACEKENRNHLIEKGAKLETELAAASQAYDCAMAIHGTVLEDLAAERAIVSRIWVQLGSPTYADLKGRSIYDLIDEMKTELARLRADLERFTGHGLLDCHAICDQRDAAVAERDQLRAEVERLKATLLSIEEDGTSEHNAAVGLRQNLVAAIARAERFEAALAEWSVLNLWGGTPEIIHEFIKGQQDRIHYCQDLETELNAMKAEFEKIILLAAQAADRIVELRRLAEKAEAEVANAVDGVIDGGSIPDTLLVIHIPRSPVGYRVGQPVKVILPAIDAAMKGSK